MMNISQALDFGKKNLEGLESPNLESEVILSVLLGTDRVYLTSSYAPYFAFSADAKKSVIFEIDTERFTLSELILDRLVAVINLFFCSKSAHFTSGYT